jgi:hypothetical protein
MKLRQSQKGTTHRFRIAEPLATDSLAQAWEAPETETSFSEGTDPPGAPPFSNPDHGRRLAAYFPFGFEPYHLGPG